MSFYLLDTNTRPAQAVAADALLFMIDKAFSRVSHPPRTENWEGTK